MRLLKSFDPIIPGWFRFSVWLPAPYDFPYWSGEMARQGRRWKVVRKQRFAALYVEGVDACEGLEEEED